MNIQSPGERLQALRSSFQALARTDQCLSVEGDGSPPAPEAADDVLILHLVGAGSPAVMLRVRTHDAHLTAQSGDDHQKAGNAVINDRLGVGLADGYHWDDAACASADELAWLLLKHMRRRLKAAGEVAPEP